MVESEEGTPSSTKGKKKGKGKTVAPLKIKIQKKKGRKKKGGGSSVSVFCADVWFNEELKECFYVWFYHDLDFVSFTSPFEI